MEIEGILLLLIVIGGGGYAAVKGIARQMTGRAIGKAPPGAGILPGDSRVEAKTKEANYRLLMQAVHVLDNQLTDDEIRPFLPQAMQDKMKSIVDDFFNR